MKKNFWIVLIVGIICTAIGFTGSYFLFGYGKTDYNDIKAELEELKSEQKKVHKAQLENGGEIVVKLKNNNILATELYDSMVKYNGIDSLVYLIDQKILEEKYSDRLEEANDYAEKTIKEYKSYYRDDFEKLLQSYGFRFEEQFKERLYINFLQNLAIEDYCKKQISDEAVKKYYDEEIVGDIKLSHILITANLTNDMSASEREAALLDAEKKANAIIAELNKVKKEEITSKFAQLAKEQSQDETTKNNGGSFGYINKNILNSSYDEIVNTAYNLKDGEFYNKVIKTELGYHVILRTDSKEKPSLENIKEDILEELMARYFENNASAPIDALEELRKEQDLLIVDSELKKQYIKYINSIRDSY